MNLALMAAPVENMEPMEKNNYMYKKRKQKREIKNQIQNRNSSKQNVKAANKVNNAMQAIYNNLDDDNELHDFQMPPPPQSMGVERTIENEQQEGEEEGYSNLEENDEVENIKDFNNTYATSYYNQYIPEQNMQSYQMPVATNTQPTSSIDDKLTYLINLLEEQKIERTENITEEIILYGFLGVFVIYVVDSCVRVGKYTR
tara:strand:+ start:639 stop:1241 length:603 start_codon:yes stop_codon:yes gene_type:complete